MAKFVTDVQKKELLALNKEDLGVRKINQLFCRHANIKGEISPPKYDCSLHMILEPGEYINKERIETTVGRFLWNKLIIEGKIDHILPGGFLNTAVSKKVMKSIVSNVISKGLQNKTLSVDKCAEFLKDFEFYMLKLVTAFSPSITDGLLFPHPDVMKERDKLLKNLPENPTLPEMTKLEDTLVELAAKKLDNDPGMTLYKSGSRGEFDNDYKNISIIIGPVFNPATGGYDMMTSNYMDGIKKQDIPKAANGVVAASHPKAVGTAVGGYITKQINSALQTIQVNLDEHSDCGSVGYITRVITKDNFSNYEYQNVIIGNDPRHYEPLTVDNLPKYLNKEVKLRSPMYCLTDPTCAACTGTRYKLFDIQNAGLAEAVISNNLMNKQMKKFHITKVKFHKSDLDKLLIPIKNI